MTKSYRQQKTIHRAHGSANTIFIRSVNSLLHLRRSIESRQLAGEIHPLPRLHTSANFPFRHAQTRMHCLITFRKQKELRFVNT